MDELDIGAALAEQGGEMPQEMIQQPDTQAPQAEPSAQEAQAVPQQETAQAPQFDPTQMNQAMASQSEQIAAIAEQMNSMNSKIAEPTPQALSEEQMLQNKIKEDLGINQMEAQYKQQSELMEQQKAMMEQMQQAEMVRQRNNEFSNMEKEFGNIDKEAIQNKLVEIGNNNPQLAEALNSPEGIRMLLKQGVGAVVNTPDAITPSTNSTNVSMDDSSGRVLGGQGTNDDFGALLASYV